MATVWTITLKDLRQRLRDRSVLLMALVVPLVLTWVFSLVFGGVASGDLGTLRFGVTTLDDGAAGQAFRDQYLPQVTQFLGAGTEVELVDLPTADAARARVEDRDVDAAFVVPDGLTTGLVEGRPIDLEVLTHADAQVAGDVATALARQFAIQARGQGAARVLADRLQLPPERAQQLASDVGAVRGRIRLDASTVDAGAMDLSTYLAAGMAVFFLFLVVSFGVIGYLEERRDGTLSRLLAAPIRRWQVLAAKGLVSFVVGIASVGTLMLLAIPMLGAAWGDPLAVALLVVAAVLSATSLVAAVASVARTAEQANVWQSVIGIVLGMLGGSFFPLDGGPAWLSRLSDLTPHAWFLDGLSRTVAGGTVADVLTPTLAMVAFALLVGGAGLLMARRVASV